MAKLINGNGNPAIYAGEDADLIASLAGNVTCIANVGNKYAATEEDANTIGLADGVIITKEGRRIQLDAGETDLFTIPTGSSGVTNYYIIGYKLVQNADSTQVAETFVQKMNSSSEIITENTFRGGATEVYVSLYRVTQVGFTIDSIDALLSKLLDSAAIKANIAQINSALSNHHVERIATTLGSLTGFTINCGFKAKKVTCFGSSAVKTLSSYGICFFDKSSMVSFTSNDSSHESSQGTGGNVGILYYDSNNNRILNVSTVSDTSVTFTVSGSGFGGDSRSAIWDIIIE